MSGKESLSWAGVMFTLGAIASLSEFEYPPLSLGWLFWWGISMICFQTAWAIFWPWLPYFRQKQEREEEK